MKTTESSPFEAEARRAEEQIEQLCEELDGLDLAYQTRRLNHLARLGILRSKVARIQEDERRWQERWQETAELRPEECVFAITEPVSHVREYDPTHR